MLSDLCKQPAGLHVKETLDEKLFTAIGSEYKEDRIHVLVCDLGEFGSHEERGELVPTEDSVCLPLCGICVVCGGFLHSAVVSVHTDGYGEAVQLWHLHGLYPRWWWEQSVPIHAFQKRRRYNHNFMTWYSMANYVLFWDMRRATFMLVERIFFTIVIFIWIDMGFPKCALKAKMTLYGIIDICYKKIVLLHRNIITSYMIGYIYFIINVIYSN